MKKIFNIIIVIAIITALVPITGCDIVEEPYLVPVGNNDGPGPDENIRKILLEDYTGQKCPNCPAAAEEAQQLKTIYGEQVVLLTIHAGFYATPDATGDFTLDYRTEVGAELNSYFAFPGYPMGLVNRAEYGGSRILLKDSWESAVAVQVEMDPQAHISITNTYNSGARKLDCLVESEFIDDLEGTFNICVFIIESGIISPQQTPQNVNQTYVHNHVLRASMNGTWGDVVGTDGLAVSGVKLTNTYSYTLPPEWNAENCGVVAFIYNTETIDVIQAEEKDL